MIAHVYKPDPFGFRDQCDEKLDEGDGKARMCGYKRSEHEIPREAMKRDEALHELAWTIVLAGQGEHGDIVPPCIGAERRGLAQRAIALIEACSG